jgi:6-phosphogluconolactonase
VNVATKIVTALNTGIEACGSAVFVASGGFSPEKIYAELVAGDYDGEIDWALVTITLVDDRRVTAKHADSNQKKIREKLLQGPVSAARFLPLSAGSPATELSKTFDVMLLGMGLDGHFASLFPSMVNASALNVDAEPCIVKTEPQGNPSWPRISMSLSMIIKSRLILLLAQGPDKQRVLAAAKSDKSLPVHHLITQTRQPIEIVTN